MFDLGMGSELTGWALVAAILSIPATIAIQAAVFKLLLDRQIGLIQAQNDRLFAHLAESQVLGGTTVGLAKQQVEFQQEQQKVEAEFTRKQLEQAERRTSDLVHEALS